VKAFDAVVRGIEKTREISAKPDSRRSFGNEWDRQEEISNSTGGWMEGLELNLSMAMDADHKRLVKSRRAAVA
jgi:hypothetical protein